MNMRLSLPCNGVSDTVYERKWPVEAGHFDSEGTRYNEECGISHYSTPINCIQAIPSLNNLFYLEVLCLTYLFTLNQSLTNS